VATRYSETSVLFSFPSLLILSVLTLYTAPALAGLTQDGCGPWIPAETATEGQEAYLTSIQGRSCDLPRGISAFLQFHNTGNRVIKLEYRIHTASEDTKEGVIKLPPNKIVKAGSCQACSSRKGGLSSWEILSVELLGPTLPPVQETSVQEEVPEEAENEATQNLKPEIPEAPELPPAVEIKADEPSTTPAKETDSVNQEASSPDGLVTEDGKIIPWDEVPVEFRPKDKR
jgi:hypothetical protein